MEKTTNTMANRKARAARTLLVGTLSATLALQGGIALAQNAAGTADDASINGVGEATATTASDGQASVKIEIAAAGSYIIQSIASTGVDCDTVGTLCDASMKSIASSDDANANTNFCINAQLEAGTYYLQLHGKEQQANAFITVSVTSGQALSSLRCKYSYNNADTVTSCSIGSWERNETGKKVFKALDASDYSVEGYIDRELFVHAQESGAVESIAWKTGLPNEHGRFVVKMSAQEGSGYTGSAYYFFDNTDSSSLAELTPKVSYYTCGSISKIELGTVSIVPTNWQADWKAISSAYYKNAGYVGRKSFEAAGSDPSSVKWSSGYPNAEGSYVIKLDATSAGSYSGSTYVWAELTNLHHAGSGKWVTLKKATKKKTGLHYLKCKYCKGIANLSVIPKKK